MPHSSCLLIASAYSFLFLLASGLSWPLSPLFRLIFDHLSFCPFNRISDSISTSKCKLLRERISLTRPIYHLLWEEVRRAAGGTVWASPGPEDSCPVQKEPLMRRLEARWVSSWPLYHSSTACVYSHQNNVTPNSNSHSASFLSSVYLEGQGP